MSLKYADNEEEKGKHHVAGGEKTGGRKTSLTREGYGGQGGGRGEELLELGKACGVSGVNLPSSIVSYIGHPQGK